MPASSNSVLMLLLRLVLALVVTGLLVSAAFSG
jgi:hypothetical protein